MTETLDRIAPAPPNTSGPHAETREQFREWVRTSLPGTTFTRRNRVRVKQTANSWAVYDREEYNFSSDNDGVIRDAGAYEDYCWDLLILPVQEGETPQHQVQLDELAVGSRICLASDHRGSFWQKTEDGWYIHSRDGSRGGSALGNGQIWGPAWHVLRRVSSEETWTVGQLLDMPADFTRLPVGSVINRHRGPRYTKRPDRAWGVEATGRFYPENGEGLVTDNWVLISVPSGQAPPPLALGVGDVIETREQFAELPIGTVITSGSDYYVKTADDSWDYSSPDGVSSSRYGTASHFSLSYNRIHSLPTSPEVRELMDIAVRVLNQHYDDPAYTGPRDGGFWLTGIAPLPTPGTEVLYASWFGLPENTLLFRADPRDVTHWTLLRVRGGWDNPPEVIASNGREFTQAASSTLQVVAIGGTLATPRYAGPAHFRQELHAMERKLAARFRWCESAQYTLQQNGLPQPSDEEVAAELAPSRPVIPFAVGDTFTHNAGSSARFEVMPDGSVFSGNGHTYVKANGQLVSAANLRVVGHSDLRLLVISVPESTPEPF